MADHFFDLMNFSRLYCFALEQSCHFWVAESI